MNSSLSYGTKIPYVGYMYWTIHIVFIFYHALRLIVPFQKFTLREAPTR